MTASRDSGPYGAHVARSRLLPLTLTALGVVYGDIGTSPLYALRESFYGTHSVPPSHENVLGVLSFVGVGVFVSAIVASSLVIVPFVIACGLYPGWLATQVEPSQALQYE